MTLNTVWTRLGSIGQLTFSASSSSSTGWSGDGEGMVKVSQPKSDMLVFSESGTWTQTDSKQLSFTNVFRWTLLTDANIIRLEHLRFGKKKPIYLFDLGVVDDARMATVEPHI